MLRMFELAINVRNVEVAACQTPEGAYCLKTKTLANKRGTYCERGGGGGARRDKSNTSLPRISETTGKSGNGVITAQQDLKDGSANLTVMDVWRLNVNSKKWMLVPEGSPHCPC